MKNYIVRNCPALFTSKDKTFLYDCCNEPCKTTCKDITDCVLKRIVEITKGYEKACGKHCDKNRKENNCEKHCNAYKIRQILELLEIEECENE